jgi:hypothetical protein
MLPTEIWCKLLEYVFPGLYCTQEISAQAYMCFPARRPVHGSIQYNLTSAEDQTTVQTTQPPARPDFRRFAGL